MISPLLLACVLINTLFLFVLLIKTLFSTEDKKYESIRNSEIAILGIAFTQYALTFIIENSDVLEKDSSLFAQQLRYFDWLITTPLLLYTYWKLAEVEGYGGEYFLLFAMDMIMIICGMIAEIFVKDVSVKFWLFAIGTIAYGIIFWKILEIMNFFRDKGETKKKNLGWFFIFGWAIYPLAFFLGDEAKFILYSFGDFINKGIYSIYLSEIIS
jgi:bacteriorhodopsin